jgi:hypothetical protein
LQLLESGSEKIRQTVIIASKVIRWLYVVMIILIWRLIGCSYWKFRQIFRGNKYQRRQAVIVSLPTWIGFTKSQRIWTWHMTLYPYSHYIILRKIENCLLEFYFQHYAICISL